MNKVYFATSNKEKLLLAQAVCSGAGIEVEQAVFDIDEIQGEDPEVIIKDKALRAYEELGKPVIVSDDSWNIRALNGFPGPYMKSVNEWFTAEDFLRLMNGLEDRSVTLHQYLAFTDGTNVTIFSHDLHGNILNEARGENTKSPSMEITALDMDNGKSIAEIFSQGEDAVKARFNKSRNAWHEFVDWYKKEGM